MDTLTGIVFGLFIIAQLGVIWECIRMKGTVTSSTLDLRTEMGNLGTLLDEALDYIADIPGQTSGFVGNTLAQPDIKEMLLSAFLSKMAMPPDYGSPQESKNWKNDEVNSTQVETETESN